MYLIDWRRIAGMCNPPPAPLATRAKQRTGITWEARVIVTAVRIDINDIKINCDSPNEYDLQTFS